MITKILKGFYDRKGNRWSLPVKDGDGGEPSGEGYDDSELRDLIAAKADKNHTHSEYISKTADIDSEPAEGSENLITSGAVYSACSGKAATSHTHNISDIRIYGSTQPIVTQLPLNPAPGTKCIYIGPEFNNGVSNGLVFGQTYEYKQTGEYTRTIMVSGVLTNTNFSYVKQALEQTYHTGTIWADRPPQGYDEEEYCMFDDMDITIHQSLDNSTYDDWGHDLLDVKNLLEGVGLTVNMYDSDDTTPSEAWTPVFALKSELPAAE